MPLDECLAQGVTFAAMAQDEIYAATARVLAILRDPRTSEADALDVLRTTIHAAYCKGREDGARDMGDALTASMAARQR